MHVEPLPLGLGTGASLERPTAGATGRVPARLAAERTSGSIGHTEQVARYQWVAQLAADRDVLDAGCGAAYGTRMLAAAGARRVVGVDRSAEVIAGAMGRAPELELMAAELHDLPLPTASFDLVVGFGVPAETRAALAELHRVLRPEGCAVLCFGGLAAEPLEALVLGVFRSCRIVSQQLWAATVIGENPALTPVPEIGSAGQSRLALAIAGDGALPRLEGIAALAHIQELDLWQRRLEDVREELHLARRQLSASQAREEHANRRARQAAASLERASRDGAELLSAQRRIFELEEELLAAGKTLEQLGAVVNSKSWRMTSPLRAAMGLLRR